MMKDILAWILANPGMVVAAVVFVLGILGRKSLLADARVKMVEKYAHVAFHAVEELASSQPDIVKGAEFLDQIDTLLEAAGQAPLTDAEKAGATAMAKAINQVVDPPSKQDPPPPQP